MKIHKNCKKVTRKLLHEVYQYWILLITWYIICVLNSRTFITDYVHYICIHLSTLDLMSCQRLEDFFFNSFKFHRYVLNFLNQWYTLRFTFCIQKIIRHIPKPNVGTRYFTKFWMSIVQLFLRDLKELSFYTTVFSVAWFLIVLIYHQLSTTILCWPGHLLDLSNIFS